MNDRGRRNVHTCRTGHEQISHPNINFGIEYVYYFWTTAELTKITIVQPGKKRWLSCVLQERGDGLYELDSNVALGRNWIFRFKPSNGNQVAFERSKVCTPIAIAKMHIASLVCSGALGSSSL
jgi:hypothetical protein